MRLGLEPELNTMMEKETMATEKMVPFTMGTLDTKSIGLTSATIRARAYLRQGPLANCQRLAVRGWASNARRYARSRWPSEWATGSLQSNVVGPGSKGSLPIAQWRAPQKAGAWRGRTPRRV